MVKKKKRIFSSFLAAFFFFMIFITLLSSIVANNNQCIQDKIRSIYIFIVLACVFVSIVFYRIQLIIYV